MGDESSKPAIAAIPAELKTVLGPPPVLSTENAAAYEEIWAKFVDCFRPQDFVAHSFVRQLADCTWDILRYTRHKNLMIERKFRQQLENQAERMKLLAQRRDTPTRPGVGNAGEEANQLERTSPVVDINGCSSDDLDEVLKRAATEFDHACALEEAIEYHGKLDYLLNAALRRRNDVLDQYDRYTEVFRPRAWENKFWEIDEEIRSKLPNY
jgi:hypothetical protein